jgi:hypothetical protein
MENRMISVKKAKAYLADSQHIYLVTEEEVKTFEPKFPVRFTHVDGIFLYGADLEIKEFEGKELQPNAEDLEPEVVEVPPALEVVVPAEGEVEVAVEAPAEEAVVEAPAA